MNNSPLVRIIHLSDLHVLDPDQDKGGADFKEPITDPNQFMSEPLKRILTFLKDPHDGIKAHYLVVTGDFASNTPDGDNTEQHLRKCFEEGRRFLKEAASYLDGDGDKCHRVIVVPGNHDADWTTTNDLRLELFKEHLGYEFPSPFYRGDMGQNIKTAENDSGARCFAFAEDRVLFYALSSPTLSGVSRPLVSDLRSKVRADSECGHPALFKDKAEAADFVSALGALERIDGAGLKREVIDGIRDNLLKLKFQSGVAVEDYCKIALLHHHLSPVGIECRSYEAVLDAADAKAALASAKFDMVLHGHKHQPENRFEITSREPNWGLHIVGAGSATGACKSRASFYVLDIENRHCSITEVDNSPSHIGHEKRPNWSFLPGRPPQSSVPVIAWPGYRQARSIVEAIGSSRIKVLEHNGIGGNLNELRIDRDECVMVIDDLDVLERWSNQKSVALRRDSGLEALYPKLAKGVSQLLVHGAPESFSVLPLRCGLNAIAYNADTVAIPAGTTYSEILFSPAFNKFRLGFWDRPVVNIPLLLLASEVEPSFYGAIRSGESQMKDLTAVLGTRWLKTRVSAVCIKQIAELRQALLDGTVDIVVGGGAWLHRGESNLRTFVPQQGALLWLECASLVSANDDVGRNGLRAFSRRLLDTDVQEEIAVGEEYSACPVVPTNGLWELGNYDITEIFLDSKLEALKPNRHLRRAPGEPAHWVAAWQEIKRITCGDKTEMR